ncbi:hypothetical protein F3J45_01550 [Pantoea sp. Ap-967]|uniref:NEL-type E3 ubiquitin ligase domain-containing protein n=1 Tax=Pantoea sp. Ap-967 TaxID=2608362 RepID=UPI001422DF67|nr:NEL-type E3 ubiquitin ligase domain-containing protein [Pantoea sp. Ap-967]NIE73150.1 hypothetical protein [Pantoea sp. Ap-967]
MQAQPDSPISNAGSRALEQAYQDHLLAQRLPPWVHAWRPARIDVLNAALQQSIDARQRLQAELAGIEPLERFVEHRLQPVLAERFKVRQPLTQLWFRDAYQKPLATHAPIRVPLTEDVYYQVPLLEATLRNFTSAQAEVGGLPVHAGLRDAQGAKVPGIEARAFAGLCRELDLGQRYQQHLAQVLQPAAAPGRVKALLGNLARSSMLVDAFKARHEQVLSEAELQVVIDLCHDGRPGHLGGDRVVPRQLHLLGCELQQILVLDVRDEAFAPVYTSSRRVLVYIPGDPQGPWHAFDNVLRFVRSILGQRLREPAYQRFFSRFVRRRDSQAFFSQVIAGYHDLPIWANIDLGETLRDYPEPLFEHLAAARIAQIKDDGATLIMPVASLDRAVQAQHEQRLEAEGWALLGMASLFVPALGTLLLAVTAWQLLKETFRALDAWHEGASREALAHLGNVAKDTAIIAATATGLVVAQRAWARAWAVDSLVPARLERGGEQLWDGDITPFRVAPPPREASRDALGVHRLGEQAWVEMDGHYYPVRQRSDRQWQLNPLAGHGPLLRHNGAGAWRVWSEQPAEWDDPRRMFRRLGGQFAELDDGRIDQLMQAHDLAADQLRALHVYGRAPDAGLLDSLLRVRLMSRIEQLAGRLRRGEAGNDPTVLAYARRLPGASALAGEPMAEQVLLQRRLLFQRLYEVVQDTDTPGTAALRRVFPGLHRLGAQAVLEAASATDRQRLLDDGRVSLRLSEAARASVQRTRIVRAREAFYLDVPQNADHARLVLGMLEHLGEPAGAPALRVFDGSLHGPLLASTTGDGVAFDLVHVQYAYQLMDAHGQAVGAPGELFDVLSQAYDAQQRAAMNLGTPFAASLRAAIAREVQARPAEVEQLLHPAVSSGLLRPPLRLADGRLGYPLSGRGPGRAWGRLLPRSALARLRDLYPSFTDDQMLAWLEYTSGSGQSVAQELARLERQFQALNDRLNAWVRRASDDAERESRRFFREAMRSCWQRRTDGTTHASVFNADYRWSLYGARPGALPELPTNVNFDHVFVMSLRSTGIDTIPDSFLRAFSNVRILEMPDNRLTRIPQPLMQMQHLECLDLANNLINLDASQSTILASCENLTYLNLAFNPLGRGFSVSALPRLQDLHLANCQLDGFPHGVTEHAALRRLDVRNNLITAVPADFYASRLWVEGHVQVRGNPLTPEEAQLLRTALQVYHPEAGSSAAGVPERLRWMDMIGLHGRVELGAYWDELEGEPGSEAFFDLIGGLRNTAEFRQPRGAMALARRVFDMLQAMHEDTALRRSLFDSAHQLTCQDSVALRFGDLELQVRVWRAEQGATPGRREQALLRLGRQLWRLEEVDRIALQDIQRRTEAGGDPDQVEVMLAYRVALRTDLDLPLHTQAMLYRGVSGVTASRAAQARAQVLDAETDERLAQALVQRDFWRNYLSHTQPGRFEALNGPFHERLEALQEDQQLPEGERLAQINRVAGERQLAEHALMVQMTLDALSINAEQTQVMVR